MNNEDRSHMHSKKMGEETINQVYMIGFHGKVQDMMKDSYDKQRLSNIFISISEFNTGAKTPSLWLLEI